MTAPVMSDALREALKEIDSDKGKAIVDASIDLAFDAVEAIGDLYIPGLLRGLFDSGIDAAKSAAKSAANAALDRAAK